MGSLMSGWSSSVLSDKEVRQMRNRSLTKEEVAAFWRQHQHAAGKPEGAEAAGSPVAGSPPRADAVLQQEIPLAARRLEAIRSMPPLRAAARGTRSDDDMCCSPYGRGGGHRFSSRSEPASPAATTTARVERCFFPENAAAATSTGWWTRSSWAFLNEPPKEEVLFGGRAQTLFACDQFHASRIVTGNA